MVPLPCADAVRPALLLDLDGTLTDPRDGITRSLAHALEALGAPVPDAATLARCIGPPLRDAFAELLPDPSPVRIESAVTRYRERFDRVGWRENRVYDDVPDFLDALRARGLRTLLATSKPRVFALRIARHFGFEPALDAIYGSELDGRLGHKAELVAHVLAQEGLARERAVMLGDRRHDVEGARANGLRSLGVTYGYGDRAELSAAGATWICDDLREALAVLDAAL
ncbi:MAG TPA: HAD hydrolase-like protein [Myxococcota bacterium]|nr:HAD hydrolase-like protein [Myxococcota bacterium]